MRNVIHFSSTPGSLGIWRNLAEHTLPIVKISADNRGNSKGRLCHPHSAGRVAPGHLVRGSGRRGPDAPHSGAEQKRQAADRRVGDKSHPDRNGQGNDGAHEDRTDHGRQKDISSKHFLQPPHEVYGEYARHAWQECGRVLVKIRRGAKVFLSFRSVIRGPGPGVAGLEGRLNGGATMARNLTSSFAYEY